MRTTSVRPPGYEDNRYIRGITYECSRSNQVALETIDKIFVFLSTQMKIDKRIMESLRKKDYPYLAHFVKCIAERYSQRYEKYRVLIINEGIPFMTLFEMYEVLTSQ
jgi:hypothetical protein